MSPDTDYS